MTADMNGWADSPEDERETLECYNRRCGRLLVESRARISRQLRRREEAHDATDAARSKMMQPVKTQREMFRITPPDPTEYEPRWHYCPIEGY